MARPYVQIVVDGEPIAQELVPLLHELYEAVRPYPIDLAKLHAALEQLLVFLTTRAGRTHANCCAVDAYVSADCEEMDAAREDLPEPYAEILADMGGALHDTVSAPAIAEMFESTPEQLLGRLRGIHQGS